MYITDLTHFLDKAGAIGPVKGPARAMAQFHVDVVAHASDGTSTTPPAPKCFKCRKTAVEAVVAHDNGSVDLPHVPHRGSHFELARQPLGLARSPADRRLITAANAMRLSSKLFLLASDDKLHALANTAFMRMLRRENVARAPDFAGQRVRQASIVVAVVDRTPSRMVHCTFCILDFDADGRLDVERLNTQQFARVEDWFDRSNPVADASGPIVDAARRFIARGGSWEPDERLLGRIEAAALGRLSCPRVRLVR